MSSVSKSPVTLRVQQAFDERMLDALWRGAIIVGLVYGVLAPIYAFQTPESSARALVTGAIVTAVVLIALGLRWKRKPPRANKAQKLGAVVLGAVLVNNTLFLTLFPEPRYAGTLAAVLLAAGWFFLNLSWFSVFGIATIGVFTLTVLLSEPQASWFGPLMLLFALGSLATVVRTSRARTIRRIELLSIQNEEQAREQRRSEAMLRRGQKLESLAVMAGGIAHDFNNLLTVILGNTEMALGNLGPDNDVSRMLRASIDAGARASRLTEQLLAFTGNGIQQREIVDISEEVRAMADLLRSSLVSRPRLRFDLAVEATAVRADPGQLQQVLMNLVLNAGHAVVDHGDLISIRTGVVSLSEAEVDRLEPTESRKAGRYVFVEVEDNGCGMDKDVRDRIFDPFFTTRDTGRGLGLSSVLGIVNGHGGGLNVESSPNVGTRMRIFLPASDETTKTREVPTETSHRLRVRPGTVLLIDDEDLVRGMAASMLQGQGWTVIEAANGSEGIEAMRRSADQITFCLLDMNMPGLNGEETFHALRRVRPHLPVMLTSGYSEASVANLLEMPATVFLDKPYHLATFSARLKELMGTEDGQDRLG